MIVAVGSKNPAKVEGVRRAFSRYFDQVETKLVDSSSVAKAQPNGLEEMTAGATARGKFALSKE